jgi:hypothetical protein
MAGGKSHPRCRTEDESNQKTCEDDDVVRHAEVRRSERRAARQKCRYGHPGVGSEPLSIKRTGIMTAGGGG